jgi:hypothetical protein
VTEVRISSLCLDRLISRARAFLPKPNGKVRGQRTSRESGFGFLLALGLMVFFIAATLVVLERGATQKRRQREAEAIWRGNQYVRAIRLFFHKTGRYPRDLEELQKGLPQLHFLRQSYKDPTNPSDGAWRFIYVNAAGQIIGSTKYATLQQMALLDQYGGQLPVPGANGQPGQPGVPVSSLADAGNNPNSPQGQNPTSGLGLANSNGTGGGGANIGADTSGQGGTTSSTNSPTDGQNSQSPNGQNPQYPQNPQNPQSPFGSSPTSGNFQNPSNQINPLVPLQAGQAGAGGALGTVNLAAMALLKPTGPVDGPVLGAYLTGVAGKREVASQKVYHGGKKYINWEFIWNPIEDAQAAMQQQLNGGGAAPIGQGVAGAGGVSGFSTSGIGTSSGFGNSNPGFGQQNPSPSPAQPTSPTPQQNPQ